MFGFSLKRATGSTSARRAVSKATGIPTTRSGRKRKAQSSLFGTPKRRRKKKWF